MTGTQQFILGIAATIISGVSGYLLHRRSKKSDATSAQSGAASDERAGTQQLIEGFNLLLKNHKEDLKSSREVVALLESEIEALTKDRDLWKAEALRLRKKYGENGDTPQPPNKGTT